MGHCVCVVFRMCLTLLSALDISMSPMVSAWVSFSGGLSALRRGWWCETLASVMGVILSGVDFFAVSVTGCLVVLVSVHIPLETVASCGEGH